MLLSTAGRTLNRSDSLKSSYAEISRYIRAASSQKLGSPLIGRIVSTSNIQRHVLHSAQILYCTIPQAGKETQLFDSYKQSLSFPAATHQIKDLETESHAGDDVVLHGYLGSRTDLSKNLYFVPLLSKDLGHSVQIISSAKAKDGQVPPAHEKLKGCDAHTPVSVKGKLKARNPPAKTDLGDVIKIKAVEVELVDVQALNPFPRDIIITPDTVFPPEARHLQLRQEKGLRHALHFRARAAAICRDVLGREHDFTEIETPLLFKSTPEGAREYIVPTRRKGLAYALPQSPQQFKQILMASGVSRYYQMARCFRDEDLRADRQPEFTQLDLEMSFATAEDVMGCIETLIRRLWQDMLDIQLPSPFVRMTYSEAMSKFGSDKPDVRLGMPIHRVGHLLPVDLTSKISPLSNPIVEAMLFRVTDNDSSPALVRKFVSGFMDSPEAIQFNKNPDGGPGIFIYDSGKPMQGLHPFGFEAAEEVERLLEPKDGNLIVLQARKDVAFQGGSTPIGNLRLALHKAAVTHGLMPAPEGFVPLWITDFPLFSPTSASEPGQGGAAGLASTHHPFTSPKSADDVDFLATDPLRVTGDHYDIVMNGFEIGGGSRRIHNAEMQKFVLEKVLQMTPERMSEFAHLLEVLRAGCPPHAGIALGFDRLVVVMLGKDSVRDVIAFPKSGKGEDLLVKSPSLMSEEALKTYHLRLRDE